MRLSPDLFSEEGLCASDFSFLACGRESFSLLLANNLMEMSQLPSVDWSTVNCFPVFAKYVG
jgi:hypothetical protein